MRALDLKVPPVAVALLAFGLMALVAMRLPAFRLALPAKGLVALALLAVGASVCVLGVAAFRRARTTVNPLTPEASSSLVVSGIYRFSRNPMYLGVGLMLLAWAVFLAHALAVTLVVGFVLYLDRFQIQPEERALRARFGQDFAAYASRVRRWV